MMRCVLNLFFVCFLSDSFLRHHTDALKFYQKIKINLSQSSAVYFLQSNTILFFIIPTSYNTALFEHVKPYKLYIYPNSIR